MKKFIFVLAVVSMFIASSAFGAILHTYWYKPQEKIPPFAFGSFTFDMNYNNVTNMLTVGAVYNATPSAQTFGYWAAPFSFSVTEPDANGIVTSTTWVTGPDDFAMGSGLTTFTGSQSIGPFTLQILNWIYDTDGGQTEENRFGLAPPYWSPAHIPQAIGDGLGYHYYGT